jgi:nucleotidyltransferase substrate binding protein (TIGR01987 family)
MQDIRFAQRFNNFLKVFAQLSDAVNLAKSKELSELEKQGLIQSFEYTHELAWNVLKDFLQSEGKAEIFGSKSATREAFAANLISNGEVWMKMIEHRNQTSHTYNKSTSQEIYQAIINNYFAEFLSFKEKFSALVKNYS